MSAFLSNALAILAVVVSMALYSFDWSYVAFLYYLFGLPLILAIVAAASHWSNTPRAGDIRQVLASLALGLFAVPFIALALAAGNEASGHSAWQTRCGVAETRQFWRIVKDTWIAEGSLFAIALGGGGLRIVRQPTLGLARHLATLGLVAASTILAPVTIIQIASEEMRGLGAAVAIAAPLLCASWWTVGGWIRGRTPTGARPLRRFVAASIPLVVVASTLFPWDPECLHDTASERASGTWNLLSLRQVGWLYLLVALLLTFAADPEHPGNCGVASEAHPRVPPR